MGHHLKKALIHKVLKQEDALTENQELNLTLKASRQYKSQVKNLSDFELKPDRTLKRAGFVPIKKFRKFLFYPDEKNVIISAWKKSFNSPLGWIKTRWKN